MSDQQLPHFSAFRSCLIHFNRHGPCDYKSYYPPGEAWSILVTVTVLGLINSGMSVVVFVQRHYDTRLISWLLRFYYGTNILQVIFLLLIAISFFTGFADYTIPFFLFACVICNKTSLGTLAYISVLRYVNCKHPVSVVNSPNTKTISILVLELITAVSTGLTVRSLVSKWHFDIEDSTLNSVYYLTCTLLIVVVNTLWIGAESSTAGAASSSAASNHRTTHHPHLHHHHQVSRHTISNLHRYVMSESTIAHNLAHWATYYESTVFKFAFISSVWCLITTVPVNIIVLAPPSDSWTLTCESCKDLYLLVWASRSLLVASGLCDNLMYAVCSQNYRRDLEWGLRTLAACKSLRSYRLDRVLHPTDSV